MERFDLIGAVLGSGVVTWTLSKLLGKKKEDIELALSYQDFYKSLINDLEGKVQDLTDKVELLLEQDEKKSVLIEGQRKNLLKWEANCERLEIIIRQKDTQIAKLFEEIEEHEANGGER